MGVWSAMAFDEICRTYVQSLKRFGGLAFGALPHDRIQMNLIFKLGEGYDQMGEHLSAVSRQPQHSP